MSDKILFIAPPHVKFESFINPAFNERVVVKKSGSYGSVVNEIPVGILSLSAYLKKYINTEIKLLDFNIILNKLDGFKYGSFKEMFSKVLSSNEWVDYSPTIIGISTLFTPSYQNMLDIAEVSRKTYPEALIIAGGGVPTNMFAKIFNESENFDALCYGEGELPLLGLLESDNKKEFLKSNSAWITREKVLNNISFSLDFIEFLDEIPTLDYTILNTDDYRSNQLQSLFPQQEKMTSVSYLSSRGCPYFCCFCSSHTVHGREMRYHSIERIKNDFKYFKEKFGVKTIIFQDDHFLSDKKRVYSIIEILNEYNMNAFFPNSLALYALDKNILKALKSIGVNHLVLSVESGSNRVLKEIMHKPLNLVIVERVITDCREIDIATDVSILIGLPGETKQDIEDTREFLKTLKPNWFRISMATPLAGSEMLDICLKNNYLKGDYINCDFKRAIVETDEFTPEYIQKKAYYMNLELNFVENCDFKLGNYEVALKGFENAINVKSDHAFALYFAAQCYKKLNFEDKYISYINKYQEIIKESLFWRELSNRFGLVAIE